MLQLSHQGQARSQFSTSWYMGSALRSPGPAEGAQAHASLLRSHLQQLTPGFSKHSKADTTNDSHHRQPFQVKPRKKEIKKKKASLSTSVKWERTKNPK